MYLCEQIYSESYKPEVALSRVNRIAYHVCFADTVALSWTVINSAIVFQEGLSVLTVAFMTFMALSALHQTSRLHFFLAFMAFIAFRSIFLYTALACFVFRVS
jgi:hypothetical protein